MFIVEHRKMYSPVFFYIAFCRIVDKYFGLRSIFEQKYNYIFVGELAKYINVQAFVYMNIDSKEIFTHLYSIS